METIQQTVRIELHYAVHFTRQVFEVRNTVLRDVIAASGGARRAIFIVDEGVCAPERQFLQQLESYSHAHSDVITNVASPIVVPGGEAVKNGREYVDLVRSAVNAHGICRHSFVVAVGGGAVLDMAGYAAATSHRGVRLIRLPSTVLAQTTAKEYRMKREARRSQERRSQEERRRKSKQERKDELRRTKPARRGRVHFGTGNTALNQASPSRERATLQAPLGS